MFVGGDLKLSESIGINRRLSEFSDKLLLTPISFDQLRLEDIGARRGVDAGRLMGEKGQKPGRGKSRGGAVPFYRCGGAERAWVGGRRGAEVGWLVR